MSMAPIADLSPSLALARLSAASTAGATPVSVPSSSGASNDPAVTLALSPQAKAVMDRTSQAQQALDKIDTYLQDAKSKHGSGQTWQLAGSASAASAVSTSPAAPAADQESASQGATPATAASSTTSSAVTDTSGMPGWLADFYQQNQQGLEMCATSPGFFSPNQDAAGFATALQNHTLTVTPAADVPGLDYTCTDIKSGTGETQSVSYNQQVARQNPNTLIAGGAAGYMITWS